MLNWAISKERITDLINHLSEKDLELVGDLLERLIQPKLTLELPLDDEPTTPDDFSVIKAAHNVIENDELMNLKDIEHARLSSTNMQFYTK